MCFSAEASFGAAAVLAVIGVATILKVRTLKCLPLALIPLIFAFQQLLEGILWTHQQTPTSFLYQFGLYGYLSIAILFWPIWLPGSLYALEKKQKVKKWLLFFLSLGILFSILQVFSTEEVKSEVEGHHISYLARFVTFSFIGESHFKTLLLVTYTALVSIPCFLSTVKGAWVMGIFLLMGWSVTYLFYKVAFLSVWCFFGALASVVVYFIVKEYAKESV